MRLLSFVLLAALLGGPVLAADAPLAYPAAPRGDVTETFFGTTVGDPVSLDGKTSTRPRRRPG